MIDGRRLTDSETLKVAAMVYAGWINKTITANLNSKNCKALGLCGADLFLIPSEKRKKTEIDYGFVGDVLTKLIKIKELELFLNNNFLFEQNIYAGYATFQGMIKKFGYQLGLRAEQANTTSGCY